MEQLGIDPKHQNIKLGSKLADESTEEILTWVQQRDDRIESYVNVVVWSYTANFGAMRIYHKRFTDGVMGLRIQYGSRAENLLRKRVPMMRPVREDAG